MINKFLLATNLTNLQFDIKARVSVVRGKILHKNDLEYKE